MGPAESITNIITFLYVTGGLLLILAAYLLYLRKYRRGTLEALNNVVFITSRYDKYNTRTQFLLDLPRPTKVELWLLDPSENKVKELLHAQLEAGQHTVPFNPADFENGNYYLSLVTDNANVLRKITIEV